MTPILLSLFLPAAFALTGGHEVPPTDGVYSSLVQVETVDGRTGRGGTCTGTLIADDFVVTAAHCVIPDLPSFFSGKDQGGFGDPQVSYYIHEGNLRDGWTTGSPMRSLGVGPGWRKVKSAHYSPRFAANGRFYTADVALIEVEPRGGGLHPAILFDRAAFSHLKPITVFGAGPSTEAEMKSFVQIFRVLGGSMVGVIHEAESVQQVRYSSDAGATLGCTTEYVGLDHGDSGGPALTQFRGQTVLWGVASKGDSYTVLAYFREWMNSVATQAGSPSRF